MNLLHPAALAWFGLALPIIVFYILKIRMRRVPVSTTLFWQQIFEEKQPRSIWETLRHLLSLLIQLAFLALLVFALAEPIFSWEIREARRMVLVLDNSASMNATDVAPNRLAKAKDEAGKIIDGLRFRDELAIVAAGAQPQVRCGLTGHQSTLREALKDVPPTDGPTRVNEAIELARRLLSDEDASTSAKTSIVVLTDGGFDGSDALAKAGDVRVVSIGTKSGNAGITRFQVRRSLLDPIGYQILAEVVNASDQPYEARLEIDLEGNPVDVVPLKLEPGGKFSQVFEKTSAEGGKLIARLNKPDGLAADNTATAILPRRELQKVTLVTDGNLFLQKVFEANPLVELKVVKELPAAQPPGVIVFHKKVPAKLPAGPVLAIDPSGSTDLWTLGETIQNPIVTKQEKDSPLMSHVRLDNVMMPEARKLTIAPGGKIQTLAQALSGDPLFASIETPAGKALVLTVELEKGDLPLQTAFPILVANALGWFAGTKGDLRESLATGTVADVALPPGSTRGEKTLSLRSPEGSTRIVPVSGESVTIGPLDRVGVWTLLPPGEADGKANAKAAGKEAAPPILDIAVNLASRRETDLRPPSALDPASDSAPVAGGYGGWPIWFILTALAWGLVGTEWYLYQRRWIS